MHKQTVNHSNDLQQLIIVLNLIYFFP